MEGWKEEESQQSLPWEGDLKTLAGSVRQLLRESFCRPLRLLSGWQVLGCPSDDS